MAKRDNNLIFFVFCLFFHMSASFAHSVTPTLFGNLGLGNYMFGVVLAAMLTVNFIVSPFWGKLNGMIPSKISLSIGCFGYALGQVFFALSRTELQFIIARAFTGLFTAACYVSLLTYTMNLSDDPQKRGANLTVVATLQMVGNAFGYLVGGLLGEISLAATFIAQIGVLTMCAIAFQIICRRDKPVSAEKVSVPGILRKSNPLSALLDGKKFMTPELLVLFIIVMLQCVGIVISDQSSNYYLRDVFGLTSGYNGVIKGVTGLLTLGINVLVTVKLVKRYKVNRIVAALFALCGVFMSGVVFWRNPAAFIAFNILFYASGAAILPLLQRILAQLSSEEYSSLAMGFYNSMGALGNIIGALSSGLLYAINPNAPFALGLVAYIIAFLLAFFKLKTTSREAKS